METTWPYLPQTKPADQTRALLEAETGWLDVEHPATLIVHVPLPDGDMRYELRGKRTILRASDLKLLWGDRSDWRFYALELERRGKWRRR